MLVMSDTSIVPANVTLGRLKKGHKTTMTRIQILTSGFTNDDQ